MNDVEQLSAIEEIKRAKARYFRGVDTSDPELVRAILAEDCVLDYRGCCTDPSTGHDFLPAMNVVLRGASSWSAEGFAKLGIVSAHHGYNFDVTFTSDTTADVVLAMTDRLFMPPGGPWSRMTGHGYYHETYEKIGGRWKLKTVRISRLRVEAA